jgi:hypothetical protein
MKITTMMAQPSSGEPLANASAALTHSSTAKTWYRLARNSSTSERCSARASSLGP